MATKKTLDKNDLVLDGEVTVDLTGMKLLGVGNGVRNYLRPIITESSKLVSKLGSGLDVPHTIAWVRVGELRTYHRELP